MLTLRSRVAGLLIVALLTVVVATASANSLTWNGGGYGVSFPDEANWTGTASTGGIVDLGNLVDDFTIDDPGAVVGGGGGVDEMNMPGGTLTLLAGKLTGLSKGLRRGTVSVLGGSMERQFLSNGATVTLGGTGTITLNGGGIPVNASTIEFTSLDATLNFNDETPTAFQNEHLGKVSVLGRPAVVGINLQVAAFNGASGAQVTPSTSRPPR